MAITPTDARKATVPDADALRSLEQKIDKAILSTYALSGRNSTVTISSTHFGQGIVKETLVSRYEGAGWNVKYHSDQRDGDFYQLTPQRPAQSYDPRETTMHNPTYPNSACEQH